MTPDPDSLKLMRALDRMPAKIRPLLHEFGMKAHSLYCQGYDDPIQLREVLQGWRARRQDEWLATDYGR